MREGDLLALEAVEVSVGEGAGHLTGAIRAEVEEDDGVAGVDALVVTSERIDELVAARVLLIEGPNALDRICLGVGGAHQYVIGALDALPTVVAVHSQ